IVTGGDHVFDTLSQPLTRVQTQWDLYHKILAENTKLPVHPVLGNHDIWGWANPEAISIDAPNYGKAMGLDRLGIARSYYSFDAGAWQVIVLDSMTQRGKKYFGALGPEQTEWLKGELQTIGTTKPIVVFSHIPVLAVCPFFGREERLGETEWNVPDAAMHHDARELVELFDQYNVRLLVSGHIHLVDRVEYRGMTFICDGSISGNWWKGPRLQFPEGYGVFDLHPDGRFDHRYVTYGWKAEEV
ncbi:MAG: metallophosphoesterase, partial [Tepidisphaeraceae bacterium]